MTEYKNDCLFSSSEKRNEKFGCFIFECAEFRSLGRAMKGFGEFIFK